jgi:hypothetical protein
MGSIQFSLFLYSVVTYIITYIVGHVLISLVKIPERTPFLREFSKVCTGFFVIITGYSIIKTNGVTINLGMLLLFFSSFYWLRKNHYLETFRKMKISAGLRNAWRYLFIQLIILSALYIFLFLKIYNPLTGEKYQVYGDFYNYSRNIQFLIKTGVESCSLDTYNNISAPRNLYHFGELWYSAFYSELSGLYGALVARWTRHRRLADEAHRLRRDEEVPADPRDPRRAVRELRPTVLVRVPSVRGARLLRAVRQSARQHELRRGVRQPDPPRVSEPRLRRFDGVRGCGARTRVRRREALVRDRRQRRRMPHRMDRRQDRSLRGSGRRQAGDRLDQLRADVGRIPVLRALLVPRSAVGAPRSLLRALADLVGRQREDADDADDGRTGLAHAVVAIRGVLPGAEAARRRRGFGPDPVFVARDDQSAEPARQQGPAHPAVVRHARRGRAGPLIPPRHHADALLAAGVR